MALGLETFDWAHSALGIIYALKTGVVPPTGLTDITVGRKESLSRIRAALSSLAARGPSQLDFIEGDYGDGKSHLLEVVRAEAIQRGFAVAKLVANFDSVAVHRASLVHRAISASLELPDHQTTGLLPLLRNLVDQPEFRRRADRLYDKWEDPVYGGFDQSFSVWPAGFYAAAIRPYLVEDIARWLGGEPIPIIPLRQQIGNVCTPPRRMAVNVNTLPEMVAGLARSLLELGYSGLVLLIDETENALGPINTRLQRMKNALLFQAFGRSRAPLYVAAAATPSVALTLSMDIGNTRTGLAYEWPQAVRFLLSRLSGESQLPAAELGRQQLIRLGGKITELHGRAFRWDASNRLDRDAINALTYRVAGQKVPIRVFVKRVVQLLEFCQQYPRIEPRAVIS